MGLVNIFLYCYYGKLATESFEDMSNCLYEFKWRKLPVKQQKYIIPMMANAQRPLYYHGFGIVILNLETFCNVRKIRNSNRSMTLSNLIFFKTYKCSFIRFFGPFIHTTWHVVLLHRTSKTMGIKINTYGKWNIFTFYMFMIMKSI